MRYPLSLLESKTDPLQTFQKDAPSPLSFEIRQSKCDYTFVVKMLMNMVDASKMAQEDRKIICSKEDELLKAYKKFESSSSPVSALFSPSNKLITILNELKTLEAKANNVAGPFI